MALFVQCMLSVAVQDRCIIPTVIFGQAISPVSSPVIPQLQLHNISLTQLYMPRALFVWLYLFRTCGPQLCGSAPSFLQLYLARQSLLQAVLLFCSFNCTIYHLHSCTYPGHCLYCSICSGHVFHGCSGPRNHSCGYIWPGIQSCKQVCYSTALIAKYITYIVVHTQDIVRMALFVQDMWSAAVWVHIIIPMVIFGQAITPASSPIILWL